jgi:putative FmdB family regulatory protein
LPLYEYECDVCQHRFEVIQKFSDAPVQACPKCSGAVHKLLSSPAIQFKGSGWYITDYARAGKSDEGKPAAGAEAKSSDTKGEAKGETKAEPKSETKTESSKSESSKGETKSESKPASPPSRS